MVELEKAARLADGALAPALELHGVRADVVRVPDRRQLVHLQFRRFAGCPMCDVHLRSIATRHTELAAAGVREVAVFHSPAEELLRHGAAELPFSVIADPAKRLYAAFGVESSPRALLHPRVWWPLVLAVAKVVARIVLGRAKPPALHQQNGRLGLPADFLIASDGRIVACKYGEHAYDQWSVDDVLTHARSNTRTSAASTPSSSSSASCDNAAPSPAASSRPFTRTRPRAT